MALQKVAIRQGSKYGPEYTRLMKSMIPDIVVLGDDLPLKSNLTGWWAKLEIFSPWYANLRPCVVFDLDTYILDETVLEEFNELQDCLWLIDDFNHPQRPESGIFVAPSDGAEIWAKVPAAVGLHYGDGPFLGTFPHKRLNRQVDGIQSYKVNQLYESPKNARIVCFHGKPKPHETTGWARDYWTLNTSVTRNSSQP